MQTNPVNLYKLLEHLKVRKGMFLGNDYNFNSLSVFIEGFKIAASDGQLELDGMPSFGYFNTWILGHLPKHYGHAGGWHWQISSRNPNNDEKAFEEFFSFLEIFKASKTHTKSMVVDDAASAFYEKWAIEHVGRMDANKEPEIEAPSKILWTEMGNSTTVWLDYLDDKNSIIRAGSWEINTQEASASLAREFGTFRNDWKIHNS